MEKSKKNIRCPFFAECERKCEYEGHELNCKYYYNNAIPGRCIEDQEEARNLIEVKRISDDEEEFFAIHGDENESVETEKAMEILSAELEAESKQTLVYIKVGDMYEHPDNPRKDIGDISELTESIRKNGIMQNLTVVRGHRMTDDEWKKLAAQYSADPDEETRELMNNRWSADGYTIVIGHRRFNAAKAAGVESLPCIIADMSYPKQLETMLVENMQRNDLTIYEQAKGFEQLSMQGYTVDEISEKSGFSKSTVRKRLKMAKLDNDLLREAAGRQISMMDIERLYELDSIEDQNACLKEIGTQNFQQTLQNKIKQQNIAKMLPRVKEEIKKIHATKITRSETYGGKYTSLESYIYFYKWDGESQLFKKLSDKKMYYFLDEDYGYVGLYVEVEKAKPVKKSPEEIAKQKKLDDAWNKVEQLNDTIFNLRKSFIDNLTVTTRNYDAVMDGAYISALLHVFQWIRSDSIALHELAGTKDEPVGEGRTRKGIDALKNSTDAIAKAIYITFGDDESETYFSIYRKEMPKHKENLHLDLIYEWLIKLGYEMSDDEMKLKLGTHELFSDAASDEDGDVTEEDFDEEDENDE